MKHADSILPAGKKWKAAALGWQSRRAESGIGQSFRCACL